MSEYKYILDAHATLPNGDLVKGPITTGDDVDYLFRNHASNFDFYMLLRKGKDNRWYQAGGPEIQHPQGMIDELGWQIDKFINDNPILNKHNLKGKNEI